MRLFVRILSLIIAISFASPALSFFGLFQPKLFDLATELADKGNPNAQYILGMMYNNGFETEMDRKKAFALFQQAEQGGDKLAAFKLGCYYDGQAPEAVAVDKEKAFNYYLSAAQAGYSRAQFVTGNMLFAKGNYEEAVYWITKSAQQGHDHSISNLFTLYSDPKYGVEDRALAHQYLSIAIAKTNEAKYLPRMRELLAENAAFLTTEQIQLAEQNAAAYVPEQTPLTLRVVRGYNELYDIRNQMVLENIK